MMDDKDIRAAEELDRLTRGSYKETLEQALEARKSGMRLSRRFFETWVETLDQHAELNRRTLGHLQQLIEEQREVFEELSRESVDAYDAFLKSLDAYYQGESEEEEAASRGSHEAYLMTLERTGELRRGSGQLPDGFWDLPRPEDPEGLVRSAVQEDRR
jgi:hypothetical protein